ncbi:alpha/beta hydrolase [Salinispirillum sp. LH 10-3-1]|uniref:Alpha/beta hydrolase n=1 Tax=Salinispirillum sp. LH 10-3-1 TaxID=2952525 RepID=A0AB38YK32_9GAMM
MSRYLKNTSTNPQARILLLHGAGAPMDSDWMNTVAATFNEKGLDVVRWEFDYMHRRRIDGKKRPPVKAPKLLAELAEVVADLASWDGMPLIVAGKSMGGRMATLLQAQHPDLPITRLIALGYPFHPTGKPDRLRVDHFPDITCPLNIVQGTNDTMGGKDLVSSLNLPSDIVITWIDGGNHDLRPKGLKAGEVMGHLADTVRGIAI